MTKEELTNKITKEKLIESIKKYKLSKEIASSLGVHRNVFKRLCFIYDIEDYKKLISKEEHELARLEKIRLSEKEKYPEGHHTKTVAYKERIINKSIEKYIIKHSKEELIKAINEYKTVLSISTNLKIHRKKVRPLLAYYGLEYLLPDRKETYKISNLKAKLTNEVLYGGVGYASETIKEKAKQTMINIYGIEYAQQDPDIRYKSRLTLEERYGRSLPFTDEKTYHSKPELEIIEFIKNNSDYIPTHNDSIINPYKLDIYIPELKVAIEYNGTFYHNSNRVSLYYKDVNYHKNKRLLCKNKNIRLLQIWDYDWFNKKDLVLDKIKSILKINRNKPIFANKTNIVELTKAEAKKYLDEKHIKGWVNTCKYNYGLLYENNIVACISFTKETSRGEIELKRFVGEVFGGLEKLWKFSLSKLPPFSKIKTLIDLDWSDPIDNQYVNKLGFKFIKETLTDLYVKPISNKFDIKPRTAMGWHLNEWYLNPELKDLQKEHGYIDVWNQMKNPNIKDLILLCDGYYTCTGSGTAVLEYKKPLD